ncbi:MAG: hypothetical protein ACLFQB_12645 [Chitinispirillaceae bacterium]
MIPAFMILRVKDEEGKGVRLWLPLILLWPFVLLLFLLLVPFALLVEMFTAPRGVHPFHMLIALGRVLASLGGIDIDVTSAEKKNGSQVKVKIF